MSEQARIDAKIDARIEASKVKEKPETKSEPSQFDRVLRESSLRTMQPVARMTTEQATHHAVREVKQHEERSEDRRRKDEGERDKHQETKGRDDTREGKSTGHRVVAKGNVKQGNQQSQSQQGDGQGFGGKEAKRKGFQFSFHKGKAGAEGQTLGALFQQELKAKLAATKDAPRMTQTILNQLVQAVRAGFNADGEKEIQLELREKILKGLKLKVTKKGKGRVSVLFHASHGETKALLEAHQQEIRSALAAKGIEVAEFTVT